jgi:hypothetical protein
VIFRNDAKTVMLDSSGQPEQIEGDAREARSTGWLAWSLWIVTMALEVAAIWLSLGNSSLGGGSFAPEVFPVPGFASLGEVIAARRANTASWLLLFGLGLLAAAFTTRPVLARWLPTSPVSPVVDSGARPARSSSSHASRPLK